MPDFPPLHQPGYPILPSRVYNVLLPPDVDWKSIRLNVVERDSQVLPGTYDVDPAEPALAAANGKRIEGWMPGARIFNGRDMNIYGRNAFYPDKHARLLPYAQMRKWKFARVEFRPALFNPVTHKVKILTAATIQIQFERSPQKMSSATLSDRMMDDVAPELFANFETAKSWYASAEKKAKESLPGYAIITSTNIVKNSAVLPAFMWEKQVRGFNVILVTETNFMNLNGPPPNERAEKIRTWLIDHYQEENIDYVLLIGDPRTGQDGDIPMKLAWPLLGHDTVNANDAPTDEYYADLTGNWDLDSNGLFGTWDDYDNPGGVDLYADVNVGRIPSYQNDFLRYATLDKILQKTINFENQSNITWRKNVLLPESCLWEGDCCDDAKWAENMLDVFLKPRGYSYWRQYQQGSFTNSCDSIYPSEEELRGNFVVRNRWMSNYWGVVCWSGHGCPTSARVGPNEAPDGLLFDSAYASSLNDNYPSFTYQNSCANGDPRAYDNLQYFILKCGGIATVSGTRTVWLGGAYGEFWARSTSQGIGYYYMNALTYPFMAGFSLFLAKRDVIPFIGDDCHLLANHFGINLYGDPTVSLVDTAVSPYPLPNDLCLAFNCRPKEFSFPIAGNSWCAVGVYPSTSSDNCNMKADDNESCSSPYEFSLASLNSWDFIVINGSRWSPATHYAQIYSGYLGQNDGRYRIMAQYQDVPTLNAGQPQTNTIPGRAILSLYQAVLFAGSEYTLHADVPSANDDLGLYVFDPLRTSGSITDCDWATNRESIYISEWERDCSETLTFTAPRSGTYGIVVMHNIDSGSSVIYTIQLDGRAKLDPPTHVVASDGFTNKVTVSWNAVPGAIRYCVYTATNDNPDYDAIPVSGWQTSTQFDCPPVLGFWETNLYWVRAAIGTNGEEASVYSEGDPGYTVPSWLISGTTAPVTNNTTFQLIPSNGTWSVVGIRNSGGDHWGVRLGSLPDNQLALSANHSYVNLCVIDGHHAETQTLRADFSRIPPPIDGSGATVEYEEQREPLDLGGNGPFFLSGNYISSIWNVHLIPATYVFTIQYDPSSAQNLDLALFSSQGGKNILSLDDQIAGLGHWLPEERTITLECTVTNEDDYGLCIWAYNGDLAQFDINISRVGNGLWTGLVSSDWHTPGNWAYDTVPDTNINVTIPAGTPFYPAVFVRTGLCHSITIESGASLTILTNRLLVDGTLSLRGLLSVTNSKGPLEINRDVIWTGSASVNSSTGTQITVRGNWTFGASSVSPQITAGLVTFAGVETNIIYCLASNCVLPQVKCLSGDVQISEQSTAPLSVNKLRLESMSTFCSYSAYPLVIHGPFETVGHFYFYRGIVEFDGSVFSLWPHDDCFFHDVIINTTNGAITLVSLDGTKLCVSGNVWIAQSGINNSYNLQIEVGGDWSNAVGTAGFVAHTSVVSFICADTNASQHIYGRTDFYDLIENSAAANGLQIFGTTQVARSYTALNRSEIYAPLIVASNLNLNALTCTFALYSGAVVQVANLDMGGRLEGHGGTLVVQDIVDGALRGSIDIHAGDFDLTQGTNAGESVDLEGDMDIRGGVLNIRGGYGNSSFWPGLTNASISMSDGLLDLADQSLQLVTNGFGLAVNITGGTIRTPGNFICRRTDFRPSGGTLEMVGASPAYISVTPTGKCHSLKINKSGSSVVASNSLTLGGDFLLESGTFTAPPQLSVGGNWSNGVGPAAFVEGTGVVQFIGSGLILNSEDFSDVRVCSGGHIYVQTNCEIHVQRNLLITNGLMRLLSFSTLDVDGDIALRSRQSSGLNAGSEGTCIFVGGNWRDDSYQHTTLIGFYPSTNCPVSFIGTTNGTLTGDSPYFHHLILDRAGGSVRANNNITLSGNFIISNGTWSSSSTGLTCSVGGDIRIEPGGWWGVTSNNTLKLSGDRDQSIANRAGGGPFSQISDQKNSGTITLLTSISTMNRGGLSVCGGTFDINSNSCLLAGSAEVLQGALSLGPAGRLGLGSNGMLTVESGGQLLVAGESGNPATINRTTNGYFEISVESGGYISAENAVFEYLGIGGIQVQNNAVVDPEHPFTDCTFRNGQPGGRLLSMENNQDLRIQRANFPTDAGSGAYNVRKNKANGHLYFTDATGLFSGPAYESDPNNLIDWDQGLISGLNLFIPRVATAGGKYDFTVIASPDYATLPITYRWQITGMDPLQHSGNTTDAVLAVTWDGTGQKTVWVLASNVWNSLSVGRTVDVQKLDISEVLLNSAGNALVFRIAGTSSNSYYNVQVSTNLCSGAWEPVAPGGVNLRGNDGTMSRTIILTNQNPSALRGFYRAVVNEPDRAGGRE